MSNPSAHSVKISCIQEMIQTVKHFNEALFMAAGSLPNREWVNALQSLSNEMDDRLHNIIVELDEMREELK